MAKIFSSNKVSPARQVAFQILWRVLLEDAFAANLLASNLTAHLSSLDRSLTQEIVLGVLRNQQYIDHLLTKISGCNLEKLDTEVLLALRIGIYQILYLTRVPLHAIVNDSVNLVKINKKTSASGLVNAVLRKVASNPIPNLDDLPIEGKIALKTSHPKWLIKKWVERYGVVWADSLAFANNTPALVYFRVNTLKIKEKDLLEKLAKNNINITPCPFVKGAFQVVVSSSDFLLHLAKEGFIYFQDAASQLVANLVDAMPGMKVFDVCAAPAGKTTAIAAQMNNSGFIIAGDLHLARVKLIKETIIKMGAKIITPICYDATLGIPFSKEKAFDRILVDAPCSGTGTFRHNPEIKLKLSEKKILELTQLQISILDNVANLVADKGRLIYSTCSLEYEENENVMRKFLDKHPDFQVIRPNVAEQLISQEGFVRTWPHRDGTDGFFAVVLEKKAPKFRQSI